MLNTRITERHKQGEHYVTPDIVRERYINGLNLLNHYFNKPDILELFDNSKQMTRIAEITHGQILELADSVPEWITKYLGKHLQPGLKQEKPIKDMTFEEVRKTYQESKQMASEKLKKVDNKQENTNLSQKKKQCGKPKL